jgi:RNA polymerase sigma-70 factor (ECF subfamily)
MNTDEKLLVKQAQSGDREALGKLWDLITPKLFGYLINTLRDKQLAEDILQTTWLKAIKALHTFQSRGAGISPWLFAIAKNECKQHWRKEVKNLELDDATTNLASANYQTNNNHLLLVEQVLNKLSEEDKELLRLRYIADLPPNDIAKILNINFVALRVRLHRAIKRAQIIANQ